MSTYYVTSKDPVDGKIRIKAQFCDLDEARLFIQGTNYCIEYDEEAMESDSALKVWKGKVVESASWHTMYSMHLGEGCSPEQAERMADSDMGYQ